MTYSFGQPVVVTRHYVERPSSGQGWDQGFAYPGSQWIVKEHPVGHHVRCWRMYDYIVEGDLVEGYEEADIPASCLELITGGERDDDVG